MRKSVRIKLDDPTLKRINELLPTLTKDPQFTMYGLPNQSIIIKAAFLRAYKKGLDPQKYKLSSECYTTSITCPADFYALVQEDQESSGLDAAHYFSCLVGLGMRQLAKDYKHQTKRKLKYVIFKK